MSAAAQVLVLTLPERLALAALIRTAATASPDAAVLTALLPALTKES